MAEDRRLTKIQRNDVFQLLLGAKLDPGSFAWRDAGSTRIPGTAISKLVHRPTGYYFRFDFQIGDWGSGFYAEWRPDHSGGTASAFPKTWVNTAEVVIKWARGLRLEIEAPDLWATAAAERTLLLVDPEDNRPFAVSERELVAQHLRTIEDYAVRTFELTQEQHEFVKGRLAYLEDRAAHFGRFDWKNLAASTFIGIVLQLGLTPERANGLMHLAGQLLGPLLGGAMRMLGGG